MDLCNDMVSAKCPKCGAAMTREVLTVNPPIHIETCPECGYRRNLFPPLEEKKAQKPPMGCKPYYVHIQGRICDLCDAIRRSQTDGDGNRKQVRLWATEIIGLVELNRMLRREEEQKTWVEDEKGHLIEEED